MKSILKLTTAAGALAGAALFCAPANAAYIGVGVGPIGFDAYSGGYCDRSGCPYDYWTYPIFYGPVYYDNAWYRGPVYYRTVDGERWYWIHGAWHRDQWRGARPGWARIYHYGAPLGLDYYREHGFRVRDTDWRAWEERNDRYRTGYRESDHGGYYGNEERYPDQYRDDGNRDRDQYRDYDRDRYNERDMDQERGYGPNYDRDRGTYEHSGYDRNQYYGRGNEDGADYDRDRGYHRERGYENSGYDRSHNGYGHSDYDHSGGASGSGYSTHHTTHHTTHTTYHRHHDMNGPSDRDQDHSYMHTQYEPGQGRMQQDHMRSDMDRTRPEDQTRNHENPGATDQDRSGSENGGYQHTGYEQQNGSHGHAKPPPVTSHSSHRQKPATNPDEENNGPSD